MLRTGQAKSTMMNTEPMSQVAMEPGMFNPEEGRHVGPTQVLSLESQCAIMER